MLKELFTFHSKQEDHRVMVLILILLGVALLINPANAYTEIQNYTVSQTGGMDGWPEIYFDSQNLDDLTKVVINGTTVGCYEGSRSQSKSGTLYKCEGTGTSTCTESRGTYTWEMTGAGLYPAGGDATFVLTLDANMSGTNYFKMDGGQLDNCASTHGASAVPFLHGAFNKLAGHYWLYEGTDVPSAPVINDFTKDATCYAPGEAMVLESNVTGTVDSWLWEIYDSSDIQQWSSTDSVETIVDHVFAPGLYQAQLYVENTGGSDFLSKDNWINVTQAGGCGPIGNWSNPFPTTTVTTIPTQQFYETMTMPPHIVTNMSGINAEIDKGIFGNMSQGYRSYVDYVGEQANTTFTGTFRTLLTPVSLVVNAISYAIGLFSTSINSLTVYTTVPLAITAIVINYMPWQIVTLITAGIAIDAILIIILGR